jgi:hypothetical protein
MPNKVLILSEPAHAELRGIVSAAIIEQAGKLKELKPHQEGYDPGHATLAVLTGIFAQLTEQVPPSLESSGYVDQDRAHTARVAASVAERMRAKGLDPERDDPRALDPVCIHGLPFTAPCVDCMANEAPAVPPTEMHARPDVTVATGGEEL